jgi:hypothetical protein
MIGHMEVIDNLQNIKSIIVFVGKKPSWYNPKDCNGDKVGLIYTESSRPKKNDLWFIKNNNLQLLHGTDASDEVFAKWYVESINCKPKSLVAVDSTGEIYAN